MSGQIDRRDLLKNAVAAVEEMRVRLDAAERVTTEPIAIVGIGCRLPGGVSTPDQLWDLLAAGRDVITEVPEARWAKDVYATLGPEVAASLPRPRAGFVDGFDEFDPHFFSISPREAASMDPQHRMVLESSWHALEHAAIAPDRLRGSLTGVFIGITAIDYPMHTRFAEGSRLDVYAATGGAHNAAAGRVSYLLGLQGPSMAIDTACSSSLTALHLACQSLRLRECHLALAGGVNTIVIPDWFVSMSRWGMLSPDGRCRAFDRDANGMVRSEGCGIVALKRLSDAESDGDRILAVILGSAVNQDGASGGLTIPNGRAQEALVRQALHVARVQPAEVSYVEAHGTGTPIGDPIELEALDAVMTEGRSGSSPLIVGSIKTNLGHLESAAGIAGLIKVVLAMQHDTIPAHLHFNELSPAITLRGRSVVIPRRAMAWPRGATPRIAGVSSFGLSGTNAHVVLEEPPIVPRRGGPARDVHVMVLSARSPEALSRQAVRWRDHLATHEAALDAADVAHTANTGRAALSARAAVVGRSTGELATQLEVLAAGQRAPAIMTGVVRPQDRPRVVMLFTGQGSQYHGMGRDLYASQPVFRQALDRCDAILRDVLGRSVVGIMHDPSIDPTLIDRTEFAQPGLFALEYALTEMWRSWGLEPAAVIGHSVGEYVAACVAGVFGVEDALTLIAARGRLMQALPGGAMAAVLGSEADVRAALAQPGDLSIAAVNGPDNVVISGSELALGNAIHALEQRGLAARRLTVSHAFHSALMDPMVASFERLTAQVTLDAPRLPLVSNLTGAFMRDDEPPTAKYWAQHLREAVRFADGIRTLGAAGYTTYLEVGPTATLAGMARRVVGGTDATFLASLRRERSTWHELAVCAGALFSVGVPIDWQAYDRGFDVRTVSLPTYPFERQRYWIEASPHASSVSGSHDRTGSEEAAAHPLLGRRLSSPLKVIQFQQQIALASPRFLADHVIHGRAVFPGAAYAEMALAAAEAVFGAGSHGVSDLMFSQPLVLPVEGSVILHTNVIDGADGTRLEILASAGDSDNWTTHAQATLECAPAAVSHERLDDVRARCVNEVSPDALLSWYRDRGLEYGPSFRAVDMVWSGSGEAVARLTWPATLVEDIARYRLHPAITDACMQALMAAVPDRDELAAHIPINLARLVTFDGTRPARWAHTLLRKRDAESLVGDIWLYDDEQKPIAVLVGLRAHAVMGSLTDANGFVAPAEYGVRWVECDRPTRTGADAAGEWIVIAPATRTAADLAEVIEAAQGTATIVAASDGSAVDAQRVQQQCREAAVAAGLHFRGVVLLSGLVDSKELARFDQLQNEVDTLLAASRGVLQAGVNAQLLLITRGCQATDAQEPVNPTGAPLWALARTISAEHPHLPVSCIDADSVELVDLAALWRAVTSYRDESQIAIRARGVLTPRLTPASHSVAMGPSTFALDTTARGVLDNLVLRPLDRIAPGPGEVEIAVSHAGLNFRDVLNALGVYEGEAGPLGAECVGTVTALGSGVRSLNVGDQVFGMVGGSLRSHVVVDAQLVARTPRELTAAAAATVPVAFLTVEYGLNQLARLRAGDRILIHAGTGGVGLAALQLAQRAGAEIFATAGNDEKRALLAKLGVAHVFDSRSTAFAEQILARTDGRGVDVVLNSLAGDFITASVRALGSNGRFVEIGNTGIWTTEQMRAVRPDVAYFPVYLGAVDRDLFQRMLQDIVGDVEAGRITPLPRRVYRIDEAADAFRFMAQARHIGKVVIDCGAVSPHIAVRGDATYLITGGFGALGLHVARWLAGRGARHLALVGRRGADHAGAADAIAALTENGVHVRAIAAELGNADDCARVFAELASGPELRGVIHAAGVVDDATVEHIAREQVARVFAAKVHGTWNLHRHTRDRALDFFVLFSSASSLIPAGGQGSYAAANAYLDAMAHHRGALGLPALSVSWGPWAGDGMAADRGAPQRWRRSGVAPITPGDGLAQLERLLGSNARHVAVLAIDWQRFAHSMPGPVPSFLSDVVAPSREQVRANSGTVAGGSEPSFVAQLEAAPPPERAMIIHDRVKQAVRQVLGVEQAYKLDATQGLRELGMDSLMAVELRNHLQAGVGRPLPSTLAFDCPSIGAVAAYLSKLLGVEGTASQQPVEPGPLHGAAAADLHDISDADAEMVLARELER